MITYPDKPWEDGQTFKTVDKDGEEVIGTYDAEKNAWTFTRLQEGTPGGGIGYITTEDVHTLNARPTRQSNPFSLTNDPNDVRNQQETNWWLYDHLGARVPIFDNDPPTEHPDYEPPDNELIKGDVWVNTTTSSNYVSFIWDGTDWIPLGSDRPPIISLSPPVSHPKFEGKPLENGDFWIDDNKIMHYWTGSEWQELLDSKHYEGSVLDYVKKVGDTMTGALVMDNAGEIEMKDTNLDFVRTGESLKDANGDPVLDADGKEQWDSSLDRFSHIESLPPRILRSDGTFGGDTSAPFGIRVEIDDGNTYRNRFVVGNRHGDAITVTGGTGPNVQFGTGFDGNQNPPNGDMNWEAGEEGGVKITGIPTPTKDNTDSSLAVNKRYVDDRDEELRQGIIELEEEIDSIAPSVERGKWRFTAVGTVANPGQFTMYDAEFGSGNPTGLFKSAKSIWFNAVDNDGITHAFGDVDDGELLEIFVDGAPEYGLYEVVGQAHDETLGATSFWVIDVNFVRTIEDTAAVAPGEVCRFKVFMAPTGGDASSFVMKTGDTMTGQLLFYGYKPEADGNPAQNVFNGVKIFSRVSSTQVILEASTGAKYTEEYLRTNLVPKENDDITNKKYVDGKFDFSNYTELS